MLQRRRCKITINIRRSGIKVGLENKPRIIPVHKQKNSTIQKRKEIHADVVKIGRKEENRVISIKTD